MDGSDDTEAMKEALGGLRVKIRDYALKRPSKMAEPDGNVGEVMEREPEIDMEASEYVPTSDPEKMQEDEPEQRTVLESFTPRIVREEKQEMLHVKRGPGRPRKGS